MNKKTFLKDIFPIIRVILYLALLISFALIPTSFFEEKGSFCFTFLNYGFKCPSCGVTRGFSNFMHLNFAKAFEYNPFYTIAIFPIAIIVMINDSITIIKRMIKKDFKYSYLEFFFSSK